MSDIVIKASPSKPVTVTLVDVEYKIKPPKMSTMAVLAKASSEKDQEKLFRIIEDLVNLMFNKQAAAVLKRLDDPEDLLDYQQILDAAGAVMEHATGNPTT